jgi:hypothetical protein
MTDNSHKPNKKIEEMRAEYDFSGGVHGKHGAAYHEGHTVTIHQKDGSTTVQNFKLEEDGSQATIKPGTQTLLDLRGSISVSGEQDFDAIRKQVVTKRAQTTR